MVAEVKSASSGVGTVGTDSRSRALESVRASPAQTARPGWGFAISDKVSLTPAAKELQALASAVAQAPVVDARLVRDVRQAIADGSYVADPQRTAERLLKFESSLAHDPDKT